ncbi:MAG: biopolymer transporter ExbD, partial [Pseudobdellovibrionaceae bacterium]
MSSINITPFVDVVLVLLVIFMVTAPMLVKDILEIRLP